MKVLDKYLPEDGVAEGLWQTVHSIDHLPLKAHLLWRNLPEAEKEPWRAEAVVAIRLWKESKGYL
jgi:hypothetical protein